LAVPGAGVKALNSRIRSVKSTQQITKAMKMVAAAKLNRSQGRMLSARPYARQLIRLMQKLSAAAVDASPLFEKRVVARRLIVVITSDKGLCGSYNLNIIKTAQRSADASAAEGVDTSILTIGKKAGDFFERRGYSIFDRYDDFNGEASVRRAAQLGDRLVRVFLDLTFDEVQVVYAQYISTMVQRPSARQLLPITPLGPGGPEQRPVESGEAIDYIWEPDRTRLLDLLMPVYLRNRITMILMEAFTSEHAARMTSMTSATANAGELVDALTLRRNRERQASITSELLDIVGGANAL
jgi:F-type H+-transporting ATPase subunit gamma